MKEKQDVYISEVILWEMVCDLKAQCPNDAEYGEAVRELVKLYG